MGRFDSLPNESVLQIIDYLHPSTIVPFALTCKIHHSLSYDALQRHAALRAEYSVLRIGVNQCGYDPWMPEGVWHAIELLGKILDDLEDLSYYPVAIEVEPIRWDPSWGLSWGSSASENEELNDYNEGLLRIVDNHNEELSKLVIESSFITDEDQRESWLEKLTNPDYLVSEAFSAILITLLPNVKSMRIKNRLDYMHGEIPTMVHAAACASRGSISDTNSKVLANLKDFALETTSEDQDSEPFELYGFFAALPSICLLDGYSIIDRASSTAYEYEEKVQTAQRWKVKEIRMVRCAIESASFGFLLRNIEALERLTYNYGAPKKDGVPYDAFNIVSLLDEYARHSLEKLNLTSEDADESFMWYTEHDPRIDSMKDFRNLRIIRLDDYSFQKSIEGAYASFKYLDGGYSESSDDIREVEMARVVDVLPASVRVLTLVPKVSDASVERMFSGFVQEQREMLPELREIIWEGRCLLKEEMRKQIKELGIVLKSYHEVL